LKVEKLQATIMQQQQEIETLTTKLREQATEIEEASAQLEVNQPATKAVVNKH